MKLLATLCGNVIVWTFWTALLVLMICCIPLLAITGLVFDED